MSAPVDVLRPYARDTGAFRVNNKGAAELAEALAAVFELIEMAEMADECLNRRGIHLTEGGTGRTLRAALARVQGGAA